MNNLIAQWFPACCGVGILWNTDGKIPEEHKKGIEIAIETCYEESWARLIFHIPETYKELWRKAFEKEDISTEFVKTKTGFLVIAHMM